MCKIALVLACVACASQGRRVQTSIEHLQSSAAAFNPSGPGAQPHTGNPVIVGQRAHHASSVTVQGDHARAGSARMQITNVANLAVDAPDANIIDTLARRGYDYEKERDDEWYNKKDNEATLEKYRKRVERINNMEDTIEKLEDEELTAKTAEFRKRLEAGAKEDDILEEAFAVVREAAWRTLELRHYDVQLMGGMALSEGKLAQMGTGEGKTLVATTAVYLNALSGKGAFLVTVNDYLARRDAEQMGQVYRFLGLSVGLIQAEMKPTQRQKEYKSDVVYVTNQELGFDYLRDHLAMNPDEVVQPKDLNFCIVDEGDSILVDEARVPLIISEKTEGDLDRIRIGQATKLADSMLRDVHYVVKEKEQQVEILEEGRSFCAIALNIPGIYDPLLGWAKLIDNALRAKELYVLNKQYVLRGDEVAIVDEFSGRVLEGRRWNNGLHNAMESKEKVTVQPETQAAASITYQSLFRRFNKLSSMTGTALTEAQEFSQVYELKCVKIPPALERQRIDVPNSVFKSVKGKSQAAIKELVGMHNSGRPVLVGTTTIEGTRRLSAELEAIGIKHQVLNADPKNVEREAEIVAQAGRKGSVTISTNMAGRGTDILLGGSPGYMALLRVREILAEAAGVAVPAVAKDFYPANVTEEAKELISKAAKQYAIEAKEAVAERAKAVQARAAAMPMEEARAKIIKDAEFEEEALARLHLDELMAVAASAADVYEDTATDYTREAYENVKETFQEVIAPEREEVLQSGGLHIIGTNLADSRRVDDQLRGRAGRQGDPGSSHFFVSLDDRIFRVFGGDKIKQVLDAFRIPEAAPLESEQVTEVVKNVQQSVEDYYYGIRKGIFDFDEVIAVQRDRTYIIRDKLLYADSDVMDEVMKDYGKSGVKGLLDLSWQEGEKTADAAVAQAFIGNITGGLPKISLTTADIEGKTKEEAIEVASKAVFALVEAHWEKLEGVKPTLGYQSSRWLSLMSLDKGWKNHMQAMDYVRDFSTFGIALKESPVARYRREGFDLYQRFEYMQSLNALRSFMSYDPSTGAPR